MIATLGTPAAGPCVVTTWTVALTSGLKGVPLLWTSCSRIVCGPDASGSEMGWTWVTRRVSAPSTYAFTYPSDGLGTCPTLPGCTRTKPDTANVTMAGLPLPMTAPSAGEVIASVGPAARAEGLASSTTARQRIRWSATVARRTPGLVAGTRGTADVIDQTSSRR